MNTSSNSKILYFTIAVVVFIIASWLALVFFGTEEPEKILLEMKNFSFQLTPTKDN